MRSRDDNQQGTIRCNQAVISQRTQRKLYTHHIEGDAGVEYGSPAFIILFISFVVERS